MTRSTIGLLAVCATAGALAPSAARADWLLTYEAPGAGATTSTLSGGGVETFNARATGTSTFSSNFGGSSITGTYSSAYVSTEQSFGFGGTRYVGFNSGPTSYALTLNQGVNYFGYYLAAAEAGNVITFYNGSQQVGQFNIGQLLTTAVAGTPAYFQWIPSLGWQEPFAFVNFHLGGQTFNRIVFSQVQVGGHESDNHTIGNYLTVGGVTLVPEPASLALMLAGLAGIAFVARRRG